LQVAVDRSGQTRALDQAFVVGRGTFACGK
jgi:hypothetical protein